MWISQWHPRPAQLLDCHSSTFATGQQHVPAPSPGFWPAFAGSQLVCWFVMTIEYHQILLHIIFFPSLVYLAGKHLEADGNNEL
jgi:hypothetical protein